MNANLYQKFAEVFDARAAETALEIPDGESYTFAELDSLAARFSTWLIAAGIEPGDRVTVELSPYDLDRGRITYRLRS